MPRGYRCVILAAFGWLALGASEPKQPTKQPESTAATKVAQPAPAPTSSPTLKPVDSPKYQPPCRQPQDHEPCDLEAQWKAADAADKAAWWAVVQAIFSAAGIIGLIVSLYYTRKAVLAAEAATQDADHALDIARRNADAAERTVTHAQEVAENDLRPWLSLKLLHHVQTKFYGDSAAFIFSCKIENFGKFPAADISTESITFPVNAKNIIHDFLAGMEWHQKRAQTLVERDLPHSGPILMPGEDYDTNVSIFVREADWARANSHLPGIGVTLFTTIRTQYYWRGKIGFIEHDASIHLDTKDEHNWFDPDLELASAQPAKMKSFMGRAA